MKKIIVITGILLLAFSGVKAQQLINGEKSSGTETQRVDQQEPVAKRKAHVDRVLFLAQRPEYEAPAHRGRLRAELRQKTERSRHRLRNER